MLKNEESENSLCISGFASPFGGVSSKAERVGGERWGLGWEGDNHSPLWITGDLVLNC